MANNLNVVEVRHGRREDCKYIADMIKELADYENSIDQAKLTAQDLQRDGFDTNPPYFRCIVAESTNDSSVIGFILYFYEYSTWVGKTIYMEDFYVTPEYRHTGVGNKLLTFLTKIASDGGFSRIKFECLEWNKLAIQFYQKHNAKDMTKEVGWHSFRLEKETIDKISKNQC